MTGYILAGKWQEANSCCEECIRMEENNLGRYVGNSVEPLLQGMKAAETIEYNDTVNKKEFKQKWMWEKKKL